MKKGRFFSCGDKKVFYYTDEREDFFHIPGEAPRIDGNYEYIRGGFFARVKYFVFYRLIATPLAYLYCKIKFGERIVGRGRLRAHLKNAKKHHTVGAFLVGNHTQPVADAFTPNLVSFPTRNFTVISPENLNMSFMGRWLVYLGGLPTPTTLSGARSFKSAVEQVICRGNTVTVYPEGHLWQYYRGLRPFAKGALHYAVSLDAPVFTFTRVYKRGAIRLRCVIYVDGPFYADRELPRGEAEDRLTASVWECMKKRCELSSDTGYEYQKR
jgi:hypothetical protein